MMPKLLILLCAFVAMGCSDGPAGPPVFPVFESMEGADSTDSAIPVPQDVKGEENPQPEERADIAVGPLADAADTLDGNPGEADAAPETGGEDTPGAPDALDIQDAEPEVFQPIPDVTEGPDASESDPPDEDVIDIPDSEPAPDIAEELEGECKVDSDCIFLTMKECCPSASPCADIPEVGTLNDELDALAWIQAECPKVESCPAPVAPECETCAYLFSKQAVCDKSIGECVLELEPDCDVVCAVVPESACPTVIPAEGYTSSVLQECGCSAN